MSTCRSKSKILRLTARLLGLKQKEPQPPKQNLCFSTLPPEILLYITDFLTPSSTACLGLCSRKLLFLFGSNALSYLQRPDQTLERTRFLRILAPDRVPQWHHCSYCKCRHRIAADSSPLTQRWRHEKEPLCSRRSGKIRLTWPYQMRFPHAQTVMELYRLGRLRQKDLDRLSYHKAERLGNTRLELNICAGIANGELLLHITATLHLPDSSGLERRVLLHMPELCPHLLHIYRGFESPSLLCGACRAGSVPCNDCSARKTCPKCRTRFELNGKRVGRSGAIEIQLDVWKTLGACEDPMDPSWLTQVDPEDLFEANVPRQAYDYYRASLRVRLNDWDVDLGLSGLYFWDDSAVFGTG